MTLADTHPNEAENEVIYELFVNSANILRIYTFKKIPKYKNKREMIKYFRNRSVNSSFVYLVQYFVILPFGFPIFCMM